MYQPFYCLSFVHPTSGEELYIRFIDKVPHVTDDIFLASYFCMEPIAEFYKVDPTWSIKQVELYVKDGVWMNLPEDMEIEELGDELFPEGC